MPESSRGKACKRTDATLTESPAGLRSFKPESRIAAVVADERDADAVWKFAINEVVGESLEVGTMQPWFDQMESSGFCGGDGDDLA